jgi:hypothetical protein
MSDYKQNIKQFSDVLLLTLFVGYFVGITFFPHKHVVDGHLIVHSHPFSSTEHHSHSANVLNLLQQLAQFLTKTLLVGIIIVAFFKLYQVISSIYRRFDLISTQRQFVFLRPPPVNFKVAEVN